MKENLTLSAKDEQRSGVVSRWLAGIITTAEAVGCSERSAWRLRAAMVRHGAAGLGHGNRGRASLCRLPQAVRGDVMDRRLGASRRRATACESCVSRR